jgi:hypothetical protein
MEYELFESRVMELLFKTDVKLTPQLAAFRIGCSVEVARRYLEQMASTEVLVMDVDPNGVIQYDVPGLPAPTGEPLSWTRGAAPSAGAASSGGPVHQHGVAPVNIQIHNAAPPQVIVLGQPKSVAVAAIAGLFLGPLGMLYSTGIGALVMFLVSLVLIPLTLGAGFVITAPICAIWAAQAASEHNRKLRQPVQGLLPAPPVVVQAPPPGPAQPPSLPR